jgi:transcriptional regulator with XRE-family HTH domain
VAEQAHVSSSLLSQIERGEAHPSLVSLVAIAQALGVRPGSFIDDYPDSDFDSPVVRAKDRQVLDAPFCRREYLLHSDDPLAMAEISLPPGGYSRPAPAAHAGRDYGLVLEGSVVVKLDDKDFELAAGDCIAFDGASPHRVVNASDRETARVLWIVVEEGGGDEKLPGVFDVLREQ